MSEPTEAPAFADGVFYRVRAGHLPGDFQIGYGDGLYDRAWAESYYRQCIEGGWPIVQFEEVRVTVLEATRPATPPSPSPSPKP